MVGQAAGEPMEEYLARVESQLRGWPASGRPPPRQRTVASSSQGASLPCSTSRTSPTSVTCRGTECEIYWRRSRPNTRVFVSQSEAVDHASSTHRPAISSTSNGGSPGTSLRRSRSTKMCTVFGRVARSSPTRSRTSDSLRSFASTSLTSSAAHPLRKPNRFLRALATREASHRRSPASQRSRRAAPGSTDEPGTCQRCCGATGSSPGRRCDGVRRDVYALCRRCDLLRRSDCSTGVEAPSP